MLVPMVQIKKIVDDVITNPRSDYILVTRATNSNQNIDALSARVGA